MEEFWVMLGYAVIGFLVGLTIIFLWKRKEIVRETKAIRAHTDALWMSTRAIQQQTLTIIEGTSQMIKGYREGNYRVKSTPIDKTLFEVPPRVDGEGYYSSHG